jgi:hypothetical protein
MHVICNHMRVFSRQLLCTIAVLFFSCREQSSDSSNSTRDTLLNEFISIVDTLPYYDTTDFNFKLLKAYQENDTLRLAQLNSYIKRNSTTPWMHAYLEPCAINVEFDTLTADEAYKFSFESAFCDYYTTASVIKRHSKILVVAVVCKNASKTDSIQCSVVQQYDGAIDSSSWIKFQEAITASDYWGLKEDNGHHGNDGASLQVQGFQKEFKSIHGAQARRNTVYRWNRSMDNLLEPFVMLLQFCKISKGCIKP